MNECGQHVLVPHPEDPWQGILVYCSGGEHDGMHGATLKAERAETTDAAVSDDITVQVVWS